MNIWFSSDWHLNHSNISGPKVSKWSSGYRDFDNTHEMNKYIINSINKNVSYDDIIYFLGDFCFGDKKLIPEWRSRISCKNIHFCKGNHDQNIDTYSDVFSSIQDVLTVKHGKHSFFLSHYSHRIWPGKNKGVIHLYGHSHNALPMYDKSMDIGIDSAKFILKDYRPFSIEEVINIMSKVSLNSPPTNLT